MVIRKTLIIGLLIGILIICSSCGKSNTEFLTNVTNWYHYNEITGEVEKMKFSEDGTFFWGCACGEPVGDSDLYELFEYNEKLKTIRLYNNYDNCETKIELINFSANHLLLKIDGKITVFINEENNLDVSEEYIKDYNTYGFITEGNSEELILGPFNYDGDIEYPKNAFHKYKLVDDVEFYDLQIKKHINVTTKEEKEYIKYNKLSQKDGVDMLPSNFGFIWLNDNLEVEKIVYYGKIEIQE